MPPDWLYCQSKNNMDQPIVESPAFNQEPIVPEPVKKRSYTWLLISVLFFLASGLAFFAWENNRLKTELVQLAASPSPETIILSSVPPLIPSPKASFEPLSPGVKTFTSDNLGISFLYLEQPDDGATVAVKEIDNKIYVYPNVIQPDQGQYVEVFTKEPSDSLAEAINQIILTGYSKTDCWAESVSTNPSGGQTAPPANYIFARVTFPRSDQDDMESINQKAQKCPQPYAAWGGIAYFLMDQNHSDKFVFFSIGQYAIAGDKNNTWQDTIKFSN